MLLIPSKFRRGVEPFVNPKPDGPRRVALKPAGDLLIGCSGGLGSSLLVDLVHRSYALRERTGVEADKGRNHPRNERVWKKIAVCYVEVCDVFPGVSLSWLLFEYVEIAEPFKVDER